MMTRVVAGLIQRDGLILICQRQAGHWHGLKWEFPGGKVEDGEQPAEALARELKEELGIAATVGRELQRYPYQYTGRGPIELFFFEVSGFEGEPRNLDFESICWVQPTELPAFDFLAGDSEFIRVLAGNLNTSLQA